MKSTVEAALFAVLWTVSGAFAVTGTLFEEMRLMFWALMMALVALAGTWHLIAESVARSERLDFECLVDGMIARARERVDSENPKPPTLLRN